MKNQKFNINKNLIITTIFTLTIFTLLVGYLTKTGETFISRIHGKILSFQ